MLTSQKIDTYIHTYINDILYTNARNDHLLNDITRNSSWAWIVQDAAGMSVCILCLSVVQLPNLQVATVLLILAFAYDIFFVFLTPLLFSSSIMEKVSTLNVVGMYDAIN